MELNERRKNTPNSTESQEEEEEYQHVSIHGIVDDGKRKKRGILLPFEAKSVLKWIVIVLGGLVFVCLAYKIMYAGIKRHELNAAYQQILEQRIPHGGNNIDFIPILIPLYGRPHYLRQVLEALYEAHNVEKTILVFSQDGNNEEITEIIEDLKKRNADPKFEGKRFRGIVHVYHTRPFFTIPTYFHSAEYCTAENVNFLLTFAFEYLKAPAMIMLESDLMPSYDFYDYFEYMHQVAFEDPSFPLHGKIFTVNGFNIRSRREAGDTDPYAVFEDQFQVSGWLTSKKMWPLIKAGWTWYNNWDITLQEKVRIPNGLVSLTPVVSRIKNIGMKGINFNVPEEEQARWMKVNIITKEDVDKGLVPMPDFKAHGYKLLARAAKH